VCMRRLAAIAAFALSLAVPVWAQHGGGGHGGGGGGHASGGGGHSGGFSGGHAGGFAGHAGFSGGGHAPGGSSAVHAYSGPLSGHSYYNRAYSNPGYVNPGYSRSVLSGRANPGAARPFTRPPSASANARFSQGPFLHNGSRNTSIFINGGVFRNGFRNGCIGYPCRGFYGYGYPWAWGWGYGYPLAWGYYPWWWNDDANYDQDYDDNLAQAQQMNADNLDEQQMYRQQQADGDQDAYARPPQQESEQTGKPILPATLLVFRDQHQQEVENYAIVGQTLWNFAPQHTEKIPLSDLDLAATVKANSQRGMNFRLPDANEAQ
jgi:hypothetical protein